MFPAARSGKIADNQVQHAVVNQIGQGVIRDSTLDARRLPLQGHAHAIPVQAVNLSLGIVPISGEELRRNGDIPADNQLKPVIPIQIGRNPPQRDVYHIQRLAAAVGLLHAQGSRMVLNAQR